MDAVIQFFDALHPAVLYSVLGLGAALENFIPPVPADTFVLLGGFLASAGTGEAALVFLATWVCNVAAALYVYHLGHVHGRPFFEHGWGRRLINHHQLEALGRFYARWGTLAIFVTRFLPGFRAVVPVFAGVTHRRWVEVAPPIAVASGIWYGALVWIGAMTHQNLESILGWLSSANRVLLSAALVLGLVLSLVWYRTRHPNGSDGDS
jgi:membrane protein DedA with SNARE-associated domain